MEHALLESAVETFLERDVRAIAPGILGHEQRDRGIEQDRRIEEHEAIGDARVAGGDLEREPTAERVPDPHGRRGAEVATSRSTCSEMLHGGS